MGPTNKDVKCSEKSILERLGVEDTNYFIGEFIRECCP